MDFEAAATSGIAAMLKSAYEAGYAQAEDNLRLLADEQPRRSFDLEKVSIEELKLPIRIYNCFMRDGVNTVAHVLGLSDADMAKIRNFEPEVSMSELDNILEEVGLKRTER